MPGSFGNKINRRGSRYQQNDNMMTFRMSFKEMDEQIPLIYVWTSKYITYGQDIVFTTFELFLKS